jgi:uncharacterized membrane protein YqgA involved in biofilm formation
VDGTILDAAIDRLWRHSPEKLQIELRLTHSGDFFWPRKQRAKGGGRFTEGFVATSLLFL